jgi:hypothetical protein
MAALQPFISSLAGLLQSEVVQCLVVGCIDAAELHPAVEIVFTKVFKVLYHEFLQAPLVRWEEIGPQSTYEGIARGLRVVTLLPRWDSLGLTLPVVGACCCRGS